MTQELKDMIIVILINRIQNESINPQTGQVFKLADIKKDTQDKLDIYNAVDAVINPAQ